MTVRRRGLVFSVFLAAALGISGCSAPAAEPRPSPSPTAAAEESGERAEVLERVGSALGVDLAALVAQSTSEPTLFSGDDADATVLIEWPEGSLAPGDFEAWMNAQSFPADWIEYVPSQVDRVLFSGEGTGMVSPDEQAGIVLDAGERPDGRRGVSLLAWAD